MKKINVIGKQFGKLKVIKEHSKTRNGHLRYVCECECGNVANILLTHLRQGTSKSCGCVNKNKIGQNNKQWGGYGEISGNFWYILKRNGEGTRGRKKIDFDITIEHIWELFLKQNRKCLLSGIELVFPKHYQDKSYTASLDRIDSSKGYIIGNVQWVHKDINIMKNKFQQDYFINVCNLISLNNKK